MASASPSTAPSGQGKLLFTPGPLTTSIAVRTAMASTDLGSRDSVFIALQQSVRQGLLEVGGVADTHECVLLQGSGTYAVEAVVGCAVPRGGSALVISNGAYGDRIADICKRLEITHRTLAIPWTEAPSADAVAEELAAHPADVVFMIHHETTAGIINPVSDIAQVLTHNEIFVVDSMSGFGGLPLSLDRVDFMVSSANKCIPGVPGFAFALARREALLATEGNARSLALDLLDQWRGFEKNGQFRFTPPTHALLAFSEALREHKARGGVAANHARFTENQAIITKGLAQHGFHTFIRPELQSPIITAFEYPSPDFNFDVFYDALSADGFVIYPGKMPDRKCFRVGNIGEIYPADCTAFVGAVAAAALKAGWTSPVLGGPASTEPLTAQAQVLVSGGPPVFATRTASFRPTDGSCTLRMTAASICASDMHSADGRRPAVSSRPGAECTLGHEGIGTVLAADGEALRSGVRVGDTVTFGIASSACDPTCQRCDSGVPQKCTKLFKYGHEAYGPGTELSGTYSSHMVLERGSTIVPISRADEALPASLALCCMMNCSGATAVAAVRECGPMVGRRVAVFGGGPLGLLTALRALDLGAAEVTVVDRNPAVVSLLPGFGLGTELTGEYDAVVEACGAKAVLPSAMGAVRVGGRLVLVGLVHPDSDLAGITAESIIRKCLTIVGVHNYTPTDLRNTVPFVIKAWRHHQQAFEAAGLGEAAPIFPLTDINKAMDKARGSMGRVLVVPSP
eukprot:m.205358 g.205358  ORF g.205358 m.205358 type:complete len:743 (+) comp22903_c0_seq1:64-2292(+)